MTDAPHFQQAEKSTKRSQFLQIVAKPDRATRRKSKAKSEQKLTRVAFRVSRLMEFCTKRELQNQTGHSVYDWPLVVLKELMDNALDACEEAEIAPVEGVSVTAARRLIDDVCGDNNLPLFVLHDFDVAGFMILGTLQRDTRRYQFSNAIKVTDLGLRLDDIAGLEREPAAATKTSAANLRAQLAENGATDAEIAILLNERVELNAMASDDLITMIERKLKDYGLKKVIPDNDVLADAYRGFHRSKELREAFEEMESEFEESKVKVPKTLSRQVRAVLKKHPDLRWDDAIQVVLDATQLDHVRAEKQKAKKESGDFTEDEEEEG